MTRTDNTTAIQCLYVLRREHYTFQLFGNAIIVLCILFIAPLFNDKSFYEHISCTTLMLSSQLSKCFCDPQSVKLYFTHTHASAHTYIHTNPTPPSHVLSQKLKLYYIFYYRLACYLKFFLYIIFT